MTITRYPLLIICLLGLTALSGCITPSTNHNNPWGTTASNTHTTNTTSTPTLVQNSLPISYKQKARNFDSLPTVKVALLLPLSGTKAALGESMLQAAQLALFDMGYNNFNLMPRDTQGTPDGARAAATSALNDGAELILGPLLSSSVRAVKAVAKPRNINVIAFSTDWTLADRSTFLMGFMPFSQVDRVTQYALEHGYQNFALIAPRDKYGDIVSSRFEYNVGKHNATISNKLRFTPGDPAIINQIGKLKPAHGTPPFQAIFMPVGGSQIEMISSALSYNKLMPSNVKRLGTGLWDDPRIAAQPNMQGAWFAAPSPRSRHDFEQQYYSTFGQRPVRLATLAYDATALASILAYNGFQKGSRPDFNYAALTDANGFSGTDGAFRFKPNGLVERQLAILELRDGKIIEIQPASQQF